MKAILMVCLLSLPCSSTYAAWESFFENDDAVFSIDPTTLTKRGETRTAWFITNYKNTQGDGTRSMQIEYQFNCAERTLRSLAATKFSESSGQGKVLISGDFLSKIPFHHAEPKSVGAAYIQKACEY